MAGPRADAARRLGLGRALLGRAASAASARVVSPVTGRALVQPQPRTGGLALGEGFDFPFRREFALQERVLSAAEVIELLGGLVGEARRQKIEAAVRLRSFATVPIVEGLYDRGNVSAVARTTEALGFGAVHSVLDPNQKGFRNSNRTAAGAGKWLHIEEWRSTAECLRAARSAGYRVLTTHLSEAAVPIEEVDWTRKSVLVLGNELEGVSAEALELADQNVFIPMQGMVQSFNVSVAAALCLWEAKKQWARSGLEGGGLTPEESEVLTAVFMLRHLGSRGPGILEELVARA